MSEGGNGGAKPDRWPAGESEEKYRMLVENISGHAIFMLDAGGFVTGWTKSAERVKGYAAESAGRSSCARSAGSSGEAGKRPYAHQQNAHNSNCQ